MDFEVLTTRGDSHDPDAFERHARRAREAGYDTMALAVLQAPTFEQMTDPLDTWEHFSFINAALFKVFETDLIHGYFKPETYRRNREALAWKSAILMRHGLSGSITLREPQWMPTPWYDDKPELKGCRCEQPAVARSPHWALNIDHPRVLAHYAQLGEQLARQAPAVRHLIVQTNDSGAGINWCDGLYPGTNGPADTRTRDMGERVEAWFEAIRRGARAGGGDLRIDFIPTHFTPREIESCARAFTASNLILGKTDPQTATFVNPLLAVFEKACAGTRTGIVYNIDVANSYAWSGLIAPPQVYWAAEALMELKNAGLRRLVSSHAPESPLAEDGWPVQRVFDRCVARCPNNLGEAEQTVRAVAEELVGVAHATALLAAWRDVDLALRINRMDYQHNYYFFYGTIGRRWLTRPLVPEPAALTAAERGYWSRCLMQERDPELAFRTLMAEENHAMFTVAEYPAYYNGLELMGAHFDRAVGVLEAELPTAHGKAWEWLKDQRDRIECFGCLFRNQLHVTGVQWVLDRFTGRPPEAERFARRREKKRLYDMIDGEVANCRRLIELLRNPVAPLLATGDEETYTLPRNVPDLLARKIEVMQHHRHRVENLFPDVGRWNFDKPAYNEQGGLVVPEDAVPPT